MEKYMPSFLNIRTHIQLFFATTGILLIVSCNLEKESDSENGLQQKQIIDTLASVDNSSYKLQILRKSKSFESGESSGSRQFQFLSISFEDLARFLISRDIVLDIRSNRSNQYYFEVNFLSYSDDISIEEGKVKTLAILLDKVIKETDTTQVKITNHILNIKGTALDSLISDKNSFSITQINNEATLDGVSLKEIDDFLFKLHPLQFSLSRVESDTLKYKIRLMTQNLESVLSSLAQNGFSIEKEEKSYQKLSMVLKD